MTLPTIPDIDVWRTAQAMLKRYGKEAAPIEAAARSDRFLADGDLTGQRVWQRILNAIDELQRTKQSAGEREH